MTNINILVSLIISDRNQHENTVEKSFFFEEIQKNSLQTENTCSTRSTLTRYGNLYLEMRNFTILKMT